MSLALRSVNWRPRVWHISLKRLFRETAKKRSSVEAEVNGVVFFSRLPHLKSRRLTSEDTTVATSAFIGAELHALDVDCGHTPDGLGGGTGAGIAVALGRWASAVWSASVLARVAA